MRALWLHGQMLSGSGRCYASVNPRYFVPLAVAICHTGQKPLVGSAYEHNNVRPIRSHALVQQCDAHHFF
jgi:hypothetical protein